MALTNNSELATKLDLFRSHGITRNEALMVNEKQGPWYYEQIELGLNYRMTDLQAALGASQMKRLDAFVSERHELAKRYDHLLQDLPVILPWQHPDSYSGMHLYVIRLQLDQISKTQLEVFEGMRKADILVNLHYIPVHTHPYYQEMGFKQGQFPNAEKYYQEAISIPMFPTMTYEQQNKTVATLKELLK